MTRELMMLCIGLALLGCKDQGIAPPSAPASHPIEAYDNGVEPRVVVVRFVDGVTLETAKEFLIALGLSFKTSPPPSVSPVGGWVSVPLGTEDQWVEQLKSYSIVKSAGRLHIYILPQE